MDNGFRITINGEEKNINRPLCVQFRAFFYQLQQQGQLQDYNIYVNDVLYWVPEYVEIYPIIQHGMNVRLVLKDQDPQTEYINNLNLPELKTYRLDKKKDDPTMSFASKTLIVKPDQAHIQIYNQSTPTSLQQLEKKIYSNQDILVRVPIIMKVNLIIGIQIIKNIQQTIEIFYQYGGCPVNIISESEKTSLYDFEKQNHPRDQLLEYFNFKNISIYWFNAKNLLVIQWPDNNVCCQLLPDQNKN